MRDAPDRGRRAIGAAAFGLAGPVASIGNLVFHLLASRSLGPDSYGALNALLALTVVVAVPAAAVQMSIARALLSGSVSALQLRASAARAATWVTLVVVAGSMPAAAALHLDGPLPVAAVTGYLAAVIVGLVPKAVLIAQQRFGTLAWATLVGVALRLGVGAVVLEIGGGLAGAVAAGSVAEMVATAILLRSTRSMYAVDDGMGRPGWRGHVGPVLALGGLWAFLAVDSVAARAVLPGVAAGGYAAAAVLARSVLFVPQSVATVAFPRLADPTTRARAMAWSTAAALTLAVAGVGVLAIGGPLLGSTLFGDEFVIDARLLVVLGASAAVFAVANLWVHARIAYGQPSALRVTASLGLAAAGAAPAAAHGGHALAWWMVGNALVCLWLVRPRAAVAVPFPDPACLPQRAEVDVTVVVPAWNAASAIAPHLHDVHAELVRYGLTFEVLVVDDGSTDGTPEVVEATELDAVRVLRVAHGGKGRALTIGMAEARGDVIGFIDADGDIPATVLPQLLDAASAPDLAGAVAVKERLETRGFVRHVASRGFRLVVRLLLAVDVSDTQTGAKVFRRETVSAVLPWSSERGFAWDAEFLASARRLGYRRFAEVPVAVRRSRSTIRPGAVWSMAAAAVRVASRVAMLPALDRIPTPTAGADVEHHPAVPCSIVARPPERLRILVLSWKCMLHPRAGGAEVYTHEVARRWVAAGHDVTLFAAQVDGAPSDEVVDGYRVVRGGSRLSVYREARRYWHEHRDDFDVIVDEVNTRPFDSPLWADVPVVGLFHQLARDVWWHEVPAIAAAAGRFVAEPAWIRTYRDVPIATISDSSAESLRSAGLGRVANIGCGVSLPAALPVPAKAAVPTVAFVGRMVSAKRPLDALAAFDRAHRRLGSGRLLLMGDGPIADVVRREAERVPGAEYLGRVTEHEKFAHLAESHVLVVTSVREGWGLVVDEAAAVGVHTIGYRAPGLVDSIPAAGGTVVAPNPVALAAALVDRIPALVASPMTPRPGGARSWDDVADRLLALCATVAPVSRDKVGGRA